MAKSLEERLEELEEKVRVLESNINAAHELIGGTLGKLSDRLSKLEGGDKGNG